MSTAVMPKISAHEGEASGVLGADGMVRTPGGVHDRRMVRRRGSREQGKALEFLGHSVEYLVDSRLFTKDEVVARNDREAVQILMRASREVFAECPEVVTISRRMKRTYWCMVKNLFGYDRRKGEA